MTTANDAIQNRYDIVYLFEVKDGNPNGDPDAGNLPRIDPETSHGLVTDVCLKRKVRNYVSLHRANRPGYDIYVKERAVLNQLHDKAWTAVEPKAKAGDKKKLPKDEAKARELTAWMCANFFDIRAFGAVMTTEVNCGQVRGPLQFSIARSLDPIFAQEHAVTRCAVTNDRDLEKERTMGRKFTVPYGLYRVHIYINPNLADPEHNGTGFSNDDLELFKKALAEMFDIDRSAARGEMRPRACIAFKHESNLGNARADQLFDLVRVGPADDRKPGGPRDGAPPRSYDEDYVLEIEESAVPNGVTMERWL